MSELNHQRDTELKTFLNKLDAHINRHEPVSIFVIIIENMPMLRSAYGYLQADELVARLCTKLGEKNPATSRILDNKIVIIAEGANAEKNIVRIKNIKKLISSFGLKKNNSAHISCLVEGIEVNDASSNAEEILARLATKARNHNMLTEETPAAGAKESRMQMALANQVYSALDDDKLQLVFQPIIEARTGKLHSHECLLRILDEHGNLNSAGSFIHIAEKMGIIENIDLRVLDMVFDTLEEKPHLRLSFNISNMTIGSALWNKRFFERIKPQIAKRLTVEITETAAMLDLRNTAFFMANLQETGTQVALDDFGSGYTSFRQIRALSLDYVKIDGSLIKDITTSHHNQLLVKSLLEFLKGLKLKTVAEFVDGGDTAKFLIDCGIDYMQGNYFGAAASLPLVAA